MVVEPRGKLLFLQSRCKHCLLRPQRRWKVWYVLPHRCPGNFLGPLHVHTSRWEMTLPSYTVAIGKKTPLSYNRKEVLHQSTSVNSVLLMDDTNRMDSVNIPQSMMQTMKVTTGFKIFCLYWKKMYVYVQHSKRCCLYVWVCVCVSRDHYLFTKGNE